MDNTSMSIQLYDFLNNYNLIQATLDSSEAQEKIAQALNQLSENENVLTGFIACLNRENTSSNHAFLITDNRRFLISPIDETVIEPLGLDSIDLIEVDEADKNYNVNLHLGDQILKLNTLNDEGADSINDALYSALSELLPNDKVSKIFDLETFTEEIETIPEDLNIETDFIIDSDNQASKKTSTENKTIEDKPATNSVPESFLDIEIGNEESENPEDISDFKSFEDLSSSINTTPESSYSTSGETGPQTSSAKESTQKKSSDNGKKPLNMQAIFITGGIILVIAIALGFFIFSGFSEESSANRDAKELVSIFNDIDSIYFQAVEYQEAGANGSTAEDWQELDNDAIEIQNDLNNFKTNDISDPLYQAIYFYNDALMTALYYGQSFATTGNELQKTTLEQRLNSAYQNRLAVLSLIDSSFPDLLDDVDNPVVLNEENISFPQKAEVERLLEENNTQPSGADLYKENTESSDEMRENSKGSK